jgi:hypothetical protein
MERQAIGREIKQIFIGNPKYNSPIYLRGLFFGEKIPENVILKHKDYPNGLRIPKETLHAMLSLETPAIKAVIMLKFFDVVKDATDLTINY